jgi:hypothetical protein
VGFGIVADGEAHLKIARQAGELAEGRLLFALVAPQYGCEVLEIGVNLRTLLLQVGE